MLESLLCALRQQDREELARGHYESAPGDDDYVSDEGVLCSKVDPNQVRAGVWWCSLLRCGPAVGRVGKSRGLLCNSQEAKVSAGGPDQVSNVALRTCTGVSSSRPIRGARVRVVVSGVALRTCTAPFR